MKTYNTEYDEIIVTFTEKNGRLSEVEINLIWHCLLIKRNNAIIYRTKSKKICLKSTDFYYLRENIGKRLLDTGKDSLKNASKKVVYKADKCLENKIKDAITKSNNDKIVQQGIIWRNNYSTRKKRWNIKPIEKRIIETEHFKISKLWNDSIVWKFVTKNGLKWMIYRVINIQVAKLQMLRSDLYDYTGAYIVVKGRINYLAAAAAAAK